MSEYRTISNDYRVIRVAITSEDKVLFKGEIELRQDVKSNLDITKFAV